MAITTTYKDIEIAYDENSDKWRFELHGKERSSETLASAKSAINKTPKEKSDFVPQPAILLTYSGSEIVTVTSQAEEVGYDKTIQYWIKDAKGKRSKESITKLYSPGPANQVLLNEAKALDKEAQILRKKAEYKLKEMSPFYPKS
jgi:hypothetical protein